IEAVPAGSDIDLVFRVVERPAIARIVFSGNDEVDDDDIDEKVTLQTGSILSVSEVRRQVTRIRDLYAEEGFFLARINYDIRVLPGDRGEVEVRFEIDEGAEVTVRRIRFVGNRTIDADELGDFMQTSESGFFSFISDSDTFNTANFEQDVNNIQAYYYDQGFLTVNVGSPRIELTSDREHIDITIPIEEGPRFRIGRMSVRELNGDGLEIEPLEDNLRDNIELEAGDWFSRTQIALGIQEVQRIYRDAGYARVEIVPQTDLDEERRVVDVRLEIQRGPPVRIERINISGNTKTRDSVIRRQMQILEGDLYNVSRVERSRQLLLQLRYFERVDFSEETGSRPDLLILNVEVAERPTGTFQVGAGFSSIESFILTAQVQQQNLFGNGQQLSFQLQLSGIRRLFQLRFVEPWFLGSQWSLGVDAFNTQRQFATFNREGFGGGLTLGHPVFDPRLRFFVQYQAEFIRISARTGGFFQSGSGGQGFNLFRSVPFDNLFNDGLSSSLRFTLSWDSRTGSPFRTTGGWHASISHQIADRFLGSEQLFNRTNAFVRFYRPIWKGITFRANFEVGFISSRQEGGVPFFERYRLGGIFNVRGYRLQTLGPRASVGRGLDPNGIPPQAGNGFPEGVTLGGNLQAFYQLELEFPILEEVGIFGVAFADGGNTWNTEDTFCQTPATSTNDRTTDPCSVNPFAIRTSVGFGLRWISPLGPLRFEWGIPLRRRAHEDSLRFEFTIGTSF
ncbi:MAG: outer membrane protein assembly factor BamA, partial [Planctomycetota bacterium]